MKANPSGPPARSAAPGQNSSRPTGSLRSGPAGPLNLSKFNPKLALLPQQPSPRKLS